MFVPQAKLFATEILNGVEFSPLPSISMSGYAALPSTIVTPAVVVVSVAEIAVSMAQPLFLTPTFSRTHSFLFTMPLLLPSESSIVTPVDSSFEVPVMMKFCVTVPPLPGLTLAEAGEALVQLRAASAADAV